VGVWVCVWVCGWIEVGLGEGYESEKKVGCVRGWVGMRGAEGGRRNGCIRRLHRTDCDVTLTIILNTIHLVSPFVPLSPFVFTPPLSPA